MYEEKVPPNSVEAEQSILGAVLIDRDAITRLAPMLEPADFYQEKNGWIFEAMLELYRASTPIDYLIVCDVLERKNQLGPIGGRSYITSLVNAVPTSLHAEHYASIVKRHSVRRALIDAAQKIAVVALKDDEEDPANLIAEAEATLSKVGHKAPLFVKTVKSVASVMWDNILSPQYMAGDRVFTGLPGLDSATLGIESSRFWVGAAVPRTGKCLGKGTPVLMYDGTVKPVEEVKTGELVMGPDSKPRKVLGTTVGWGQLYRVIPNKGDSYVVNEDHILSLKRTPTHGETEHKVFNMGVRDYLKLGSGWKPRMKGWRTGVEWPEKELPIPPYILGLWLGDGSSYKPNIVTAESEIQAELQEYATSRSLYMHTVDQRGAAVELAIVGRLGKGPAINPFLAGLQYLGIYQNKHIPRAYLINSRRNRLELLAGLIDTDGSWDSKGKGYDIIQKRRELAEQIAFLAKSLGFGAYVKETTKVCTNNGKSGTYYRVFIAGNVGEIPVRVERKKTSLRRCPRNATVTGITVEPIGEGAYYGFAVDRDHLFLLGDFTVTHNSAFAINLVRGVAKNNKNVVILYFHPEQSAEEITSLLLSCGTPRPEAPNQYIPPLRLKALQMEEAQREEYLSAAAFLQTSTASRQSNGRVAEMAQRKQDYLRQGVQGWEYKALDESQQELGRTTIILHDPSGEDIHKIRSVVRRVRAKTPPDTFLFVVFDGMHLIPGAGEKTRVGELMTITRTFKMMAQKDIAPGAVLVNHQLNRQIFNQAKVNGKRYYHFGLLRDSGSIEQDADVIYFLDRPSVWENGKVVGTWDDFDLVCEKNRQTSSEFRSFFKMHTATMRVEGRDVV